MTAFVGYRIDPDGLCDPTPIAAGPEYNEVFSKAFARLACEVSAFGAPMMAGQEKAITHEEAAELERICADHLEK